MTIRVLVVDDHPMVCDGLTAALDRHDDLEVARACSTAEQALEALAGGLRVDVAVLDYSLPGLNGAELTARLSAEPYGIPCLVLSSADTREVVQRCVRSGAKGYLLKDVTGDRIASSVRRLVAGEFVLDTRVSHSLFSDARSGASLAANSLTEVELKVLDLIGAGLPNHEIARHLHVSTGTVKNHVSRVLNKLGVSRRAEAVAAGARLGLLDRSEEITPTGR